MGVDVMANTRPIVDEVAVERVLRGKARHVHPDNHREICRRLAERGLTVGQIAYRAGTNTTRVRILLGIDTGQQQAA